ncbi:unnamed protein product [Hymenolepis diminuta]|uniref:FZ domain-containing protein n=1 Tax=Hymenolepis diminuta TaxID=6216 RepID=A0A564ZF16_HYMDI|nr:unnamed protein product [Hymenolepis diminuta]
MLYLLLLIFIAITSRGNTVGRWDWNRVNKTSVTTAPFGGGAFGRLTTADADMISNEPPQSPYFSDWNRLVSGYGSQRCYKIPKELKLCHKIGYDLMVLPNSLEHEGMDEVITQSEVWLTLVNLGCHDELERFLCSLYAPVCIRGYHEKLIQPCRELCESVRAACLPTMTTFGLGWPDIVKCSKFPQAPQELCIPPNKQRNKTVVLKPETRCSGCVDKPTYESAIGSFCTADVAVRSKVLDLIPVPSTKGQNTTYRIRTDGRGGIFKMPKNVNKEAKLDFRMTCDCPIIKAAMTRSKGPGRWLLMGKLNEDGRSVTVLHLSQPSRQNKGIKRAIKEMRHQPDTLCKVDLTRSSPVVHPRTVAGRPAANGAQISQEQKQQHQQLQPRRNGSNLSKEERRRRRQLRRRRNEAGAQQQQHPSNVTLSSTNSQESQQPVNDMPIGVNTQHPYNQQYQQRMGYQQMNH